MTEIKGPDFPTGALIMGPRASRTPTAPAAARSSCARSCRSRRSRAGSAWSSPSCPTRSTPTASRRRSPSTSRTGACPASPTSATRPPGRTGQRLVIVLKRDAVAKVVLNNLYKHTQLQTNFGANMLALVDGVPRTLPIDAFIRHWVEHQIDVIQRRTAYRLRKAEERIHILRGCSRRSTRSTRSSRSSGARRRSMPPAPVSWSCSHRRDPGPGDPRHAASAPRGPGAPEDHRRPRRARGDDPRLHRHPRQARSQRDIISEELAEIVGVRRRPAHPGSSRSTATCRGGPHPRGGRRRDDHPRWLRQAHPGRRYRSQRRGGKGVRGASLRGEDVVDHFFTTTSHHWLLFFTNLGRVYRAKAYELPDAGRDSKGQHVANLMAFQPGEKIAQVLAVATTTAAPTSCWPPERPGQEDPPRRVRQPAQRRAHRRQPARR
jgi:DNA gyrase subunit A